MNREQRRKMARDRRLPREDRDALQQPGVQPLPLRDPRMLEAVKATLDELARLADRDGIASPCDLAGTDNDLDLVRIAELALEDLRQRMDGEDPGQAAVMAHLLAWGVAVGRRLERPQMGVRALRRRVSPD